MQSKTIWLIILALLVVIGAVLFFTRNDDVIEDNQTVSSQSESAEPTIDVFDAQNSLIIGQVDAPKTIIEFGDYKCPTCAKFHASTYPELKRDYLDTGKARLVFRNLPYIADDSRTAAEGSYCANEQKVFADYHDQIYNFTQETYDKEGFEKEFENILTEEKLTEFATSAGADKNQFEDCLQNKKYSDKVDADLKASEDAGATGTPTFVISEQKIVGAQPITVFRTLLENT